MRRLALVQLGFWAMGGGAFAQVPAYSTKVRGDGAERDLPKERAQSTVSKSEIAERQTLTTAEVFAYEPGLFVVQASSGQGLVYIRGLTGQQTLVLLDGIRLNNSVGQRRNPNQHLQTLDVRLIGSVEALRGGASTTVGSDALGGALAFHPLSPSFSVGEGRYRLEPRLFLRGATAENEFGGRIQLDAGFYFPGKGIKGEDLQVAFLGGASLRKVGLLESAGSVENPNQDTPVGRYPHVPRFAEDGRTQLGTGYDEASYDARLALRFHPQHQLTAAAYLFRQGNAPRTDQCPPAYASSDTCQRAEERRRDLVYLAWDARFSKVARRMRVTLSYQRQGERLRLDYPNLFARFRNDDQVDTLGISLRTDTARLPLHRWVSLTLHYGADAYLDRVASSASQEFTDFPVVTQRPRGQFLDGSSYLTSGAYVDGDLQLGTKVTLRGGARLSVIHAEAPKDPESNAGAISSTFVPVVGHLGMEVRPLPVWGLFANVDHSFRAPNLDDLTGRFLAGPGFQLDNPELGAERATTFEVGMRLALKWLRAEVWAFETLLQDRLLSLSLTPGECPQLPKECQNAWYIFKQVNAPALSEIRGVEGSVAGYFPFGLRARATLGYAWGEGPNLGSVPREPQFVVRGDRIPLSLIPPVNGTVELSWTHEVGVWVGASLRWAGPQDRLSYDDAADRRVPRYGTPGYTTVDLRSGLRLGRKMEAGFAVKNLFDSPYRAHGASVNGAGRTWVLSLEMGY